MSGDGTPDDRTRQAGANGSSGTFAGWVWMKSKTPLLFACAVVLAACSPESDDARPGGTPGASATQTASDPKLPATPARLPANPGLAELADQTTGGSPIDLEPLTESALAGALEGELRCSFTDADGRGLMAAAANVDPDNRGTAVVLNGETAERLVSRRTGGFNAMEKGASFGTRGLIATIERGAAQSTGTEETRHAATLTVQRADGASRVYQGLWNCGP